MKAIWSGKRLVIPPNKLPMLTVFVLLSACSSNDIIVRARTQGSTVQFDINELSLRASGQAWYDDWIPLAHLEEVELSADWQEIGWLSTAQGEYHHLFLDADRVIFEGEEIRDIVEPTYLGTPFERGMISVELEVLEAPDGIGLFLSAAN